MDMNPNEHNQKPVTAVDMLQSELVSTINHCAAESDLNYVEIVGVLHILTDLFAKAAADGQHLVMATRHGRKGR